MPLAFRGAEFGHTLKIQSGDGAFTAGIPAGVRAHRLAGTGRESIPLTWERVRGRGGECGDGDSGKRCGTQS